MGINHKSLGAWEKIFISPSTHYAHHGINDPYIDKNFGGVFSIWDRLFGTYASLDVKNPPIIGLGDKINHHDPVEANLNYYKRMWFIAKSTDNVWDRFFIFFKTPEYMEKELIRLNYIEKAPQKNFGTFTSKQIKILILLSLIQFIFGVITVLTWKEAEWSLRIILSLLTLSAIIYSGHFLTKQAIRS